MKYPNAPVDPAAFVASSPGKSQSCSSVRSSWQVWWLCAPLRPFWSWQKWIQLAIATVCRNVPGHAQHYWQNSSLAPDAKASHCSGHSAASWHTKHVLPVRLSQPYTTLLIF